MSESLSTRTPTPIEEFQKKVVERLRDDIRDLLPDAVLQQLVTRAVEEEFFKERRVPRPYGADDLKASWFVEAIAKEAAPLVAKAVAGFIAERAELVDRAIHTFLTDEALTILIAARLTDKLDLALTAVVNQMRQAR